MSEQVHNSYDASKEAFYNSLLDEAMVNGTIAEYWSSHDPLTWLTEKTTFKDILRNRVQEATLSGKTNFGVIFIDLDDFKGVNDTNGHVAADEVLKGFAKQLVRSRTRMADKSGDVISRFGGDEFAILVDLEPKESDKRRHGQTENEDALKVVIERLELDLGSFTGAVRSVLQNELGVSIGGTVWEDGDTADDLLERADKEMYLKKRGKDKTKS